ncbi:MAG: flagellar motor protein MotB [Rhodospirillales bacterium]
MMPQDCPPMPPDESWMATYGDAVTLLMAFFVLLMSFAKVDLEVFDAVSNGIGEHMAKEDRKSEKDHLTKAMKIMMVSEGAEQVAKIASDSEGSLTIELDTGAFFRPGSADLAEQAYPFMKALYEELASPLYKQFNINVEGHTDDEPMSSIRYPSNWELSSNRAATVVRFVISESKNDTRIDTNGQKYGVEENRLRATGYAHTQPKVPNRDVSGVPIRENRITNRRVVIRINKRTNFNKVKIPKFRRKVKKAGIELDADTKSAVLVNPPMAPKDSFENKLEQHGLETIQKNKIDEIKAAQLAEVTKKGMDHKRALSKTNFSIN